MSHRRRECPVCRRLIPTNGGAWRSHAQTHLERKPENAPPEQIVFPSLREFLTEQLREK